MTRPLRQGIQFLNFNIDRAKASVNKVDRNFVTTMRVLNTKGLIATLLIRNSAAYISP